MLLLPRPVNDKASISSNQTYTGSSPRTEKALQARANSETPALSFHGMSKNFVELRVVQSTSNFLLCSALRVFSRRCYRAINLLKNGPIFLPLRCCFIMRKDKLLVRLVDWLVIP